MLRTDLGLGVLAAAAVLALGGGLGIVAIVALLTLGTSLASLALGHLRARGGRR